MTCCSHFDELLGASPLCGHQAKLALHHSFSDLRQRLEGIAQWGAWGVVLALQALETAAGACLSQSPAGAAEERACLDATTAAGIQSLILPTPHVAACANFGVYQPHLSLSYKLGTPHILLALGVLLLCSFYIYYKK